MPGRIDDQMRHFIGKFRCAVLRRGFSNHNPGLKRGFAVVKDVSFEIGLIYENMALSAI